MSTPGASSAIGAAGIFARASSKLANGPQALSSENSLRSAILGASFSASPAFAFDVMNSFAPQSRTMYSTSPAVSAEEMQV